MIFTKVSYVLRRKIVVRSETVPCYFSPKVSGQDNSSVCACRRHISRLADRVLFRQADPGSVNYAIKTLRPRQNGRHFADDISKCIFLNENIWISTDITLKCVPKVQLDNIPALVQIMVWHRPGDKPLSEPMMVSLLTYICVTRRQWVKCEVRVVTSSTLELLLGDNLSKHDDVTTWKRFSYYVSFVMGIQRSLMYFLRKGPVIWSFGVFCVVILNKRRNKQLLFVKIRALIIGYGNDFLHLGA